LGDSKRCKVEYYTVCGGVKKRLKWSVPVTKRGVLPFINEEGRGRAPAFLMKYDV
jgi:hypothetical protein